MILPVPPVGVVGEEGQTQRTEGEGEGHQVPLETEGEGEGHQVPPETEGEEHCWEREAWHLSWSGEESQRWCVLRVEVRLLVWLCD